MAGLGHRGFSALLIRFGDQWGVESTGNSASDPAIERRFGGFFVGRKMRLLDSDQR
tara:strand:- start:287 stop:454 length:168 start_codon:yes stop_codon:yes gene_type:complete